MKYQELAAVIKDNIDHGAYHETGKLPTEDSLMTLYGVTRYCVRNAVNMLVEQGYMYPVQGSGIFVRESKKVGCLSLHSTKGLAAEFPNESIRTTVIKLEIISADQSIAERLKCPECTPVYYMIRLREVGDKKFAVEYDYYNKEIIRYLNREIAEGSLYRYIRNDLGLNIGFADKVIYGEKLEKETADLLGLNQGDPAIVVEDDAYLANGQMFDASKVVYHYKHARFFTLADMK